MTAATHSPSTVAGWMVVRCARRVKVTVSAPRLLHNDYDELTFETGLNWLLTGIAADC